MIKSTCPLCGLEGKFITWTLTEVKCTNCNRKINYLKIKHEIVIDKQNIEKS